MRNLFRFLVVSLGLYFLSSAYSQEINKPFTEIKVGISLSLTGELAKTGIAEKNGLVLGFEDGNASLCEKENNNCPSIKLIIEDNLGQTSAAVTSAVKLYDIDKADIVITAFTHIAQTVKGVALRNKKPLIYISGSKYIALENELFYRDYYDIEEAGIKLAKAVKAYGHKKIALLMEENESSILSAKAFMNQAKNDGLDIVYKDSFLHNSQDSKLLILKARNKGAQAIVSTAWRDTALIMKYLAQYKMLAMQSFHLEVASREEANTEDIKMLLEKNNAISTWFGYIEGDETDGLKVFIKRYYDRFSQRPEPDAIMAYELAYFLTKVIRKSFMGSKLDLSLFKHNMLSTTYNGPLNQYSSLFFNKDRSTERPIFLMKLNNGKWEEVLKNLR